MQYISIKLSGLLIKHGMHIEDRELFEYGIRAMLRNILIFVTALVISIIFDFVISFLVFNSIFIILRQQTGGYHAKSQIACFLESLVLVLVVPFLIKVINFPIPYDLPISLIFSCLMFLSSEKPTKKRSLFFTLLILNITLIFCNLYKETIYLDVKYITITMLCNLVLLIIPKIKF